MLTTPTAFLRGSANIFPTRFFELILRRLDREAEFDRRKEAKAGYTPIPHHRLATPSAHCRTAHVTGISSRR